MAFFYRIKYDYIKFSGKDRLDLLHRLSTNDIKDPGKFNKKKTILTTDKGRIVDLLTLYNFDDFIFTICSFNNAVNVLKHIDKYTIMEDFKAEDMSRTHEVILFFGDGAREFCRDLFDIDLDKLSYNKFVTYTIDGKHTIIARNDDGFEGFILVYATEDRETIESRILNSEYLREHQVAEIDDAKYEEQRIEKGIPKLGKEMGEQVNPLECNLNQYVNFAKGCYIGQEVIARLDTYDKISKHLTGIRAKEKFTDGTSLNDLKIILDNKECGIITSAAKSEKHGYVGLGFIQTSFLDYGKEYKIKGYGKLIDCKIIKLPLNQN